MRIFKEFLYRFFNLTRIDNFFNTRWRIYKNSTILFIQSYQLHLSLKSQKIINIKPVL